MTDIAKALEELETLRNAFFKAAQKINASKTLLVRLTGDAKADDEYADFGLRLNAVGATLQTESLCKSVFEELARLQAEFNTKARTADATTAGEYADHAIKTGDILKLMERRTGRK